MTKSMCLKLVLVFVVALAIAGVSYTLWIMSQDQTEVSQPEVNELLFQPETEGETSGSEGWPSTEEQGTSGKLDYVLDALPLDEVIKLLLEGKVRKVEYPKEYKDSLLIGSAVIILKDGRRFVSGPIKHVLQAIERCGEPCKDIEIVAW